MGFYFTGYGVYLATLLQTHLFKGQLLIYNPKLKACGKLALRLTLIFVLNTPFLIGIMVALKQHSIWIKSLLSFTMLNAISLLSGTFFD